MKKLLLGAAIAALFATPAVAGEFYVEGQVGSALESELAYGGTDFDVESDTAWGGAVGITDVFAGIDLELDVMTTSRGYDGFGSSLDSLSVLVNGVFDIPLTLGPISPYAGLGLGMIEVEYDGGSAFPAFSDSEWVLGGQVFAGARANIANNFSLFGEWRYQAAEDADLASTDVEYASHSLLFGARYTFGS